MPIQFENIRIGPAQLDRRFVNMTGNLEEAYYQNWKLNLSHPFLGFDVRPTQAGNKRQFDRLHSLIWLAYDMVFHIINKEHPVGQQANENKYRFRFLDDGVTVRTDRFHEARDAFAEAANNVAGTRIKARIETLFGRTFNWP